MERRRLTGVGAVLISLGVVTGVIVFLVQRESTAREERTVERGDAASPAGTEARTPPVLSAPAPGERRAEARPVEPEPSALVGTEESVAPVPETFEERMAAKYAGFTLGQLLDARLALRETLNALTKDYYEAEFEAGRFEFHVLEPNEKGWRSIPNVPGELSSLRYAPGGEARIVRLPREGFEEAYALSEETQWILNRESELERPARTVKR